MMTKNQPMKRLLLTCGLAVTFVCVSLNAQTLDDHHPGKATLPEDQVIVEVARAVPAEYPPEAIERNIQGPVSVSVVISANGDVEQTLPDDGDPLLMMSAVKAAAQYKFKSRKGNAYVPMKCWASLSFNFQSDTGKAYSPTGAASPVFGQLIHGEQFPNQIRVSWATMAKRAVKVINPLTALGTKAVGVKGAVVIDETIGADGKVREVRAISGPKVIVDPMIGALREWEFEPYAFLGEPMQVNTQIRMSFVGETKNPTPPSDQQTQWTLQGPQYVAEQMSIPLDSPLYPEVARQKGIRGEVVVTARVGENGVVQNVQVISGDPLLVNAAKDLVTKSQGMVHMYNGKPEQVDVLVTLDFGSSTSQ